MDLILEDNIALLSCHLAEKMNSTWNPEQDLRQQRSTYPGCGLLVQGPQGPG